MALFNEFFLNQFHTGDFGHHALSSDGIAPVFARAWWCCTLHGLRALAAVFRYAFHSQGPALYYDLPVDGVGAAEGLETRAASALERQGVVRIQILKSDGQPHTLAVRQPQWASGVTLTSGEQKLAATARDGYLEITKAWKPGQVVTVAYEMRTRLVRPEKPAGKVAIFHGPWLLGVDLHGSPQYFDEPATRTASSSPKARTKSISNRPPHPARRRSASRSRWRSSN